MERLNDILLRHLENIRQGIIANMRAQKRNASGKSVQSLQVFLSSSSDTLQGTLLGGRQWEVMQRGRGAGPVPRNFQDIIGQWIKRKGISYQQTGRRQTPQQGLKRLSYLIAHSIMTKGTRLHRNHGYNDIYDTLIKEETEKLAAEVCAAVEIEADKIDDSDENH